MPLWMLLMFALCMLSAVLGFGPSAQDGDPLIVLTFVASLAAFVGGIVLRGIRRPVV